MAAMEEDKKPETLEPFETIETSDEQEQSFMQLTPDDDEDDDQNIDSEKMDQLGDDEDYDVFLQNGPPSDEFMDIFNSIPTNERNEHALDYLLNFAWSQYTDASKQVVMEGNSKAWVACAIYLAMIKKRPGADKRYIFTFLSIQRASGVSILELFDKLERYTEIVGSSKRIKEHIHKMQGSLAVSAVVYKKLLPIFRGLFIQTDNKSSAAIVSTYELLRIAWTAFCLLKKQMKQEDLLNSYNLLLCVIELLYGEICRLDLEELTNKTFCERFAESECGLLEFLCKNFGGAVLDAKHFKMHWFSGKIRSVLRFDENDFFDNVNSYIDEWDRIYNELLQQRGEVDERMFIPSKSDFHQIFDEMFDGSAVELLRRGPDDSTFADVELLLRMSTQNCLEKLTENKKNGPQASKTYILSSDNLFPTTPLNIILQNPAKLAALVPESWQLAGSQLEMICAEMKDNPLATIACNAESLAQRFADRVMAEADELSNEYDPMIIDNITAHQQFVRDLFYIIIERLVKAERDKKIDRESDLCNVYRKEEFLASVFCCSLELLLFCHESKRAFPWSLSTLELQPISFQKVVQPVIRSLPEMSKEMVKHLNKKEEEVLEELGWANASTLWFAIERNPGCIPSCDVAWKQPKMLAERYSPVKRMKLDDGNESPIRPIAGSMTLIQFIGKVYYLACNRLNDICDRIKIGDTGKRMCWTLLDHILRTETTLMLNRHLDQNLLCIVYVVAKYLAHTCTFMDLITHYRHQPQAQSYIYREVSVESAIFGSSPSEDGNSRDSTSNPVKLRCGSAIPTSTNSVSGTPEPQSCEKINLIMYYNKVFLPRVEETVKTMETTPDKLLPMPKPVNFGMSPMKRTLGERFQIFVTPLNTPTNTSERRMKYNINQSPRKDLQAINQMVNVSNSNYFQLSEDQKSFAQAFRR